MNTIVSLAKDLREKKLSSVELTQHYLDTAKSKNTELNAFISINPDFALQQAQEADNALAAGDAHLLTGIPFSAKDTFCVQGYRTTGGAKILDNYIPPYTATVIQKIFDSGAVLLGKNNCDPFGHGGSNENSDYGVVKNPWNTDRVPGGSSGGSAASVAADMSVFSIGEDTGGSIRQPAAFCSITGLKVSYGRTSRYGSLPMASSLDTMGPMTKTVADAALVLQAIAGADAHDSTTVPGDVPKYFENLSPEISGLTIGIPKEYYENLDDSDTQKALAAARSWYESQGCTIKEVSLPHTKYAVAVYYVVVPSEDSSNLARLDGMRFGVRVADDADQLIDIYKKSRAAGFPDEVKRRIMIGTYALSAGYYDAYYKKAQQVRTIIAQEFESVFNDVDILLAPTSPIPPFKIGEKVDDPLSMYMADVYVIPASVAGIPSLSIPCGFTNDNLPIGMQLIGNRLHEQVVLNAGHAFQSATDWHTKKPI